MQEGSQSYTAGVSRQAAPTQRPSEADPLDGLAHACVVRVEDPPTALDLLRRWHTRPHPFLRLCVGPGFRGRAWSILAVDPVATEVLPAWPAGRSLVDALRCLAPRDLEVAHEGIRPPFVGGWAGCVGYEARSGVEASPAPREGPMGLPALWLGAYAHCVAYDAKGRAHACALGASASAAARQARTLAREVRALGTTPTRDTPQASTGAPRARLSRARYEAAVARAREDVLNGEIFQTNISQRFDASIAGDSVALFERLVANQPAPYMTYLDVGDDRVVLSASPERFLRLRGRHVESDPMKGTQARGRTRREDRVRRTQLQDSVKDQAELAMIVDLVRNDLARTCRPGSVRVRTARRLLRFAHVHQAIGVVRGTLRPGLDRRHALAAAFPPGSVTGAPKVRAMEILDELEGEGRGPYCGALGWFDLAGDMDLSVAIRTLVRAGDAVSYRVGGGITLGSDPEAEWRETLAKGRGLFDALAQRP